MQSTTPAKRKRDWAKVRLVILVSLVWITVAAIFAGSYFYGQVQYNRGVNYGIEQTKSILVK